MKKKRELSIKKNAQNFPSVFDCLDLKCGGVKGSQKRVIYQQDIINAVAFNCYSHFGPNFSLLCEDKGFEKFDDLILEIHDSVLFLQAKFSENPMPYSFKDLETDTKKGVYLANYLSCYVKAKKIINEKTIKIGVKVKLSFLFYFNNGFDNDLLHYTKVVNFGYDQEEFQEFQGETRKFAFGNDHRSKQRKDQFIQTIASGSLEALRRITEVELPDLDHDKYIEDFIKSLSKFLEKKCSINSHNTIDLVNGSDFKAAVSKPLFLGILDLDGIDEKRESQNEIKLKFRQDFIENNKGLTGMAKKIRGGVVASKNIQEELRDVLKEIVVICPKNLFKLETVPEKPRKTEKVEQPEKAKKKSSNSKPEPNNDPDSSFFGRFFLERI